MKIAICAIAKNEKYYINDWVSYHINLGIDHIYLYDNEDLDSPIHYEDFIDAKFIDRITIINARGRNRWQGCAYNDCFQTHKSEYDWIAFIDVDEFISLTNKSRISDVFSDGHISKYDCIRIAWMICSNDEPYGDLSIPVYMRDSFTRQYFCNVSKSIVNCKADNIVIYSCHGPSKKNGEKMPLYLPNGDECHLIKDNNAEIDRIDTSSIYIRHYHTKSASEYKVQKMFRTDAIASKSRNTIDFFFSMNDRTPVRENILNNVPVEELKKKLESTWTNRPTNTITMVQKSKEVL